jgi:hypothetical protein
MTAPPFVPPTPIRCAVRIQGQTVQDGSDPDSTDPTVLSGLRITWGRSTTVDQPDSASVAFDVEDRSGNRTFARLASLGRIVEVTATGTTYTAETAPTFLDPGFEAVPLGPAGPRARADAAVTATVEAGPAGHRLRVAQRPGQVGNAGGVLIPPAAFGDPSDPAVWDAIPVAQPGQPWSVTIAAITRAPGSRLYAYAAQLVTPWDPNPSRQSLGEIPAAALADWTVTYTPSHPGSWQGLYVTGNPSGYRWADVDPAVTWATIDPALTWQAAGGFTLDGVDIAHPAGSIDRTVLAFVGRITDAEAAWDEGVGACIVNVIAADNAAELANRDVGAEPWPMETLASRAARILAASGAAGVTLFVDDAPGAYLVGRVDVDRQQVYPMLADLATTADAVLWSAGHSTTGAYLRIEDPHARPPVRVLIDDGGVIVIGSGGSSSTVISACEFDLEPVRYLQTNSDIATRTVVYWDDQTGAPDPVQRSATTIDAAAEAPDGLWGVRRVTVTSQLTTEADALAVGAGLLRRLGPPSDADDESASWRIGGLTYRVEPDADTAAVATALALLDDTTRIGRPVTVTELPGWSPIPGSAAGYLEGGIYRFEDGAWALDLLISSATGLGASAAWADLDPAWAWDEFDPGIRWIDLVGVGADTDTERAP